MMKKFFSGGVMMWVVLGIGLFVAPFLFGVAYGNIVFFDSLIPAGTSSTFKIGDTTRSWDAINGSMFFYEGNVGFGDDFPSPPQRVVVSHGIRLHTAGLKACNSSARGGFWIPDAINNVTDTVKICIRSATGTYEWNTIY